MTNEKRLIDANALMAEMKECSEGLDKYYCGYAKAFIDHAPTVDAVEVVRCKDCKHYYYSAYAMRCVCDFDNKGWDKDDFCSYGERGEGE